MAIEPNTFWQANFWGIVGTASGLLGLVISWLNWQYSKPKIELVKLELDTPRYKGFLKQTKRKEYWEIYTLHIRFRNKKGGSGSVEKPSLIVKYPQGKKFLFIQNYKEYRLNPRTEHSKQHRVDSHNSLSTYEIEVIRHGEAWNIGGGGMVDDELEYIFKHEDFYILAQNSTELKYFIEYHNNFGTKFYKEIISVKEEN